MPDSTSLLISEVQLILAEKRTSLAAMRTGIAVLALPMTVLGFLIVTSKYYDLLHVIYFMVPLILLLTTLTALGAYLVLRSIFRLRHYDRLIHQLKKKNSLVSEFLE